MTRPKSLQVHVSFELAERVRNAAERRDISVSEWIRSLLQQACVSVRPTTSCGVAAEQ
ncbi:ribbon-helix-helix protein, CopG family [Erythrobacter donghaensis]|uniref:ribbon-helix-helix protein, CopG family n=1 Tax=Erythrobacter donghaensis TaxID=267135 RepID=UPI000B007F14|nr:ribbon-helix-helix protein, CopG family [Erythrobacter donghaensis]